MIERLHHTNERKLGRAIVAHVAKAEKTGAAGNGHNVAVITTEHSGQELLQDPVAREQVHSKHRDEVFFFAFHERLKRLYSGVVYDYCHVADVSSDAFAYRYDFFSASELARES